MPCPCFSYISIINRHTKGPQDSLKLLQKSDTGSPEILSYYFKNQTKVVVEILKNHFKNKKRVPEILSNYLKNQTHNRSLRLFKTTSKIRHRESRDSFILCTSKIIQKGYPRFLKTTSKTKKGSPTFFQTTSKMRHTRGP